MYRGFELRRLAMYSTGYYDLGKSLYNDQKELAKAALDKYVSLSGTVDGTSLQNDWFPQIDANIFISHSHLDEEKAIALAGFLNHHLGLKCFIDSCVWGYANILLKQIDNRFCLSDSANYTYDYDLRNYSTSHVHMMLNVALTKLIDKTECLFFLNTPYSINSENTVKEKTNSPWIYSELVISELIRRRKLADYRTGKDITKGLSNRGGVVEGALPKFEYDAPVRHLTTIVGDDIDKWKNAFTADIPRSSFALDKLYSMFPSPK